MPDQISRYRDAMRRHRRTSRVLLAVALALGLLSVVCAIHSLWAPFAFTIFVSLFLGDASERAHHDYRTAAARLRRAEWQHHIPAQRGAAPQFVTCCDTWPASAGLAHDRHCPRGTDAAA
ncbi:hypothetical protein [Streptomyces sp. NPDC058657]|uniref:hypothetical protein n=1 Tax=unclassified Streptomyces TaxID=2593676 RepID=UPI0036529109